MQLKNQTILVTGGGSGIGLGLAEAFKQSGNQVIVAGRSQEKLLKAKAKGLDTMTVDMADPAQLHSFAQDAIRRYPSLNCIVLNAGVMVNERLTSRDNSKTATDTIQTNLLGPIILINAMLPHLLQQKTATIMTVTSGLAYLPLAMTPTYCASKAALHSYTESLRYQLKDTSVTVQELVPPYVRTSLMGDRQANDANAMPLDEFVKEVMGILSNDPSVEEILVTSVLPLREASYQGASSYRQAFKQRNDMFMNIRRKEWEDLSGPQ